MNLQIHDNVVHDTQCDGIVIVNVDPTQPGGINVYNNVIYNAGKGPGTLEGSGGFRCIGVGGYGTSTTGTSRSSGVLRPNRRLRSWSEARGP